MYYSIQILSDSMMCPHQEAARENVVMQPPPPPPANEQEDAAPIQVGNYQEPNNGLIHM